MAEVEVTPGQSSATPNLDAAFAEEPAAPVESAPAVEADASTPATPEATPAPAQAPVQQDQRDQYIQTLTRQNYEMQQRMQQVLEQQTKMMDQQLKAQAPQMSKEDREKAIADAFQQLNTDPVGFVQAQIRQQLEDFKKGLPQQQLPAELQPLMMQAHVSNQMQRLAVNAQGTVVRPEIYDQNFQTLMKSPEVANAVYEREYNNRPAEEVIKDPLFFTHLYYEAKTQAAKGFAPQVTQSQQDRDGQGQFARKGAAPGADGKAPTAAGAGKVDPGTAFKNDMMKVSMSPFNDALEQAKWT